MIVGVAKEIKNNENRVAMTPAGAHALVALGHTVLVEHDAGHGSGFADAAYADAGAQIVVDRRELFDKSALIVKVKEPQPSEYDLLHEGLILFTYLHLAADSALAQALLQKKVTGIAYETIEAANGSLPLLSPMSEVAGRLAVQIGAHYLEEPHGGKGVLLGGVPGVEPATVVIVGGGIVGANAAKIAVGMGARVIVIDRSAARLGYLDELFSSKIVTIISNPYNVAHWVQRADLVVGAVLVPGAKAPKLVTEEMVKTMEPGSVIVDVAIDQGGCVETCDHVTTHSDPVFVRHGVIHYAVGNMPGAVARTSTLALTNATQDYVIQMVEKGWRRAAIENPGLAKGVNVVGGHVTCQAVAEALGMAFTPLEEALQGMG